jgi:hypothetical protein
MLVEIKEFSTPQKLALQVVFPVYKGCKIVSVVQFSMIEI